ncbi:MAG: cbb3-type cytochrome c oxidase subunit II [Planctomycetaceae bacterium]|nr:cbb3-type cytochrome c oxidase subunit II [Planctomycetaceae bacterium]
MFESKSGVLLVGGLGFFLFAFLSNAVVPALLYRDLPEATTTELVAKNAQVMYQFEELSNCYPEQFKKYFGEPTQENCAKALELGRQIYVNEGCWHCHSQFVRPVSREVDRWGPVARTEEYQNVLQRPVMFGTRRVGPDLSREGGRHASDWHAVHFYQPKLVSHGSTMPDYPWLFDGAPDRPNQRGLAIITYVQWLGSWLESYPYYEDYQPLEIERPEAPAEESAATPAEDSAATPAEEAT